jgi:hypothetical protein
MLLMLLMLSLVLCALLHHLGMSHLLLSLLLLLIRTVTAIRAFRGDGYRRRWRHHPLILARIPPLITDTLNPIRRHMLLRPLALQVVTRAR